MFDFLLDLIFPRRCVSCGRWGKFICQNCVGKIEYFNDQVCPYCERPSLYGLTHPRCQRPLGLDGMFVLAHYRGPIPKIIRKVKYQGIYGLFQELGNLLITRCHNKFDFDYLVPVPLHPNRERERGFNQAEKIAGAIAQVMDKSSGIKDRKKENGKWEVMRLLRRVRETRPQFDLKYKERAANVRDAFAVNLKLKTQNLKPYTFCLVDDVATTGATIFECAKVLRKAGAEKVWAICVARGG